VGGRVKSLNAGEAFALIIYLAALYTMVRPGSQGPSLVQTFGTTLASIITAATGAGGWSAGGSPSSSGSSSGGTRYA
jgi:hypothetical protein